MPATDDPEQIDWLIAAPIDPLPPAGQAETSRQAWGQVRATQGERAARLYQFVAECGERGATMDEAEDALAIPHQSIGSLSLDLRRQGLLVPTGSKRGTKRRAQAFAYRAVDPRDARPAPEVGINPYEWACRVAADAFASGDDARGKEAIRRVIH